ncbi:4-alpha-glucanotransferase, partial [Streptococcus suis]
LFATVSDTAIATMQDVLDLGEESRRNMPSTIGGNWEWRMKAEDLTQERNDFLTKMTLLYQRGNENHD